jgi:hypothetical protein
MKQEKLSQINHILNSLLLGEISKDVAAKTLLLMVDKERNDLLNWIRSEFYDELKPKMGKHPSAYKIDLLQKLINKLS